MPSLPKNKKNIWIVAAAVVIVVAGVITLIVTQGMKAPQSSTQEGAIEFVQIDSNLIPGEDAVISTYNVTVLVPAKAIESAGNITITSRELDLIPVANENWAHIMAVNVEYRDADGTLHTYYTFSSPIEICFEVTEDQWEDYSQQPDNYQVQTYSDAQQKWETLPMITHPEELQLCGQTSHLSLFAVAVKQEAVIPITGATEGPYEP